ncbi:hypothetical protein TanjilG_05234 [Lupinus angustifolius]|uniref:Uncharacterized protein n=1 Tax=Lupinus angustifolius TaxID=3871 RepID=A0A4P1RAU7_LUPAN|nr:hypothetical protein TanjilG_05234 [Lupinus angustifolius]
MSSYYFNNGAMIRSSCALVPQQPLLTNPFGVEVGKSCRLRWFNQLDPRINRSAFTEDEETRLITAHSLYGNKWALISRLFPGRTDNAVKNQWHVMKARRVRDELNHYRKRNYPNFQMGLNLNLSNNATSVSTNSSIINESVSTCNNISLTASSATPIFMPFSNLDPVHNHQAYGSQMGLLGERMVQNEQVDFGNFFGAWNGVVDQPNYSDSNSEVSASESVSTKRTTNLSNSDESENIYDNIQKPFIDFLGLGDA